MDYKMYRSSIIAEKLLKCDFQKLNCILKDVGIKQKGLQFIDGAPVQGFLQQARNTWMLKRRNPVRSIKMDRYAINDLPILRSHQRIYDLIERTDHRKDVPLKLILLKQVDGIGSAGEVLDIPLFAARNKVLLPGYGVYASPENLEKYADLIANKDIKPSSPFVHKTINRLQSKAYSVCMNLENPWTIEPWHVKIGLRRAGIIAPESAITIPEQPISGPDMSLEGKEFLVKVKINNREEAKVRFRVHHVSTDLANRLPRKEKHWMKKAQPVFADEAEELLKLNNADPKMIDDTTPHRELF